jgi:HlyD family secretion protein
MQNPVHLLQRIPAKARLALLALLLLSVAAYSLRRFSQDGAKVFQGYVEAEYVHVASPVSGALSELRVHRGQEVKAGAPLFVLEQDFERAALAVATQALKQAADKLANLQKGQRPTELKAVSARLGQASTALRLAETEFKRREKLFAERTISAEEMDRARADYDVKAQQVREMSANLSTAKLGGRSDEISAAQAEVEAAKGRVEQAAWTLAQKSQAAPSAALVFDTLYTLGEWVPAGKAVAVLLPPGNIKVRFFVPEETVGRIQMGQEAQVRFDGEAKPIPVRVSYVSAQAEYTPPILYSSDNRAKLVFMVEAKPGPDQAPLLHPGQPVDVRIDVRPPFSPAK